MNIDESQKVKLSRLARVRENQRKSRARKQNYVQELEQTLVSRKEDAKQKDIERKLFVQKFEAENRKLRDFLTFLGVQPSVIETYLNMDDELNTTEKSAIPALQGSEEAIGLLFQKGRHSRPCSFPHRADDSASFAEPPEQPVASAACQQTPNLAKENASSLERPEDSVPGVPCLQSPGSVKCSASSAGPPEQPVANATCQRTSGLAEESASSREQPEDSVPCFPCQQSRDPVQERIQEEHDSQPSSTDQSFCGCQPIDGESEPWPFNDEVSNSTLCATAEQLVNQYNIRGVDMAEIRRKLRPGFSKGRVPGEGCRVQNNVLLELLDEISND
ncbi:hypothetical protein KXV70_004735 [Aspergillus fumigatus]|nr:hypothetical protein KXX50_005749 [Aspergillus fumigatus]KAH1415118.1 hypothetical protein KXX64_006885 [Aspergillus fumigatus]KAH1495187.1 hypothetical protein KXX06_002337 [Aspergillus fumigatus]KAH2001029.1 hypothetical protein KXV45_004835 [Aspergillus fumigatus]KAH2001054.1 hypothetical protein KXV97_007109 [Aspergillus fumigatus]